MPRGKESRSVKNKSPFLFLLRAFAFFGQFVLPAVLVMGAIGSVLAKAERKRLRADVV